MDYVWRLNAALPGQPDKGRGRCWCDDGRILLRRNAELGLYRTDTSHYRDNLASGSPGLWVVLRPTGREPPFEIAAVTANPSEGEAFTESGADLVEPVPIPDSVLEMIEAFIAEHHVEHAFTKRKQRRADPDALARRGPLTRERPSKDGKP